MMARKRKKGLSERQRRILEVLDHFQVDPGYPPSIREICDETGISSTSVVNYYLEQLQEMGFIERDQHVSRGIRLLKPYNEMVGPTAATLDSVTGSLKQTARNLRQVVDELIQIPVLGRIVAGSPLPIPGSDFSLFDADSMVDVARSMLPARERNLADLFALEVQGNSMIDAMINDGDIVIMKPANQAYNGEMVSVWLTDKEETTLKYFYLENGKVRLQPANPSMQPIIIDDPTTVQVQSKVVMVIRKISGLAS